MRVLIERVVNAKCEIDGKTYSEIPAGLLVYVAFSSGDNVEKIIKISSKISKLRIFDDDNHKLNRSITDISGSVLLVSSFSLFAELKSGNRPSYSISLPFDEAKPLFEEMVRSLKTLVPLKTGVFGADMKIHSINDGPVSVIIDY